MAKIFIDDKPVKAREGMTIFQAAKDAGIDIPHLCYHPAFISEGSCRMCLVEIEGAPKLELACSTQIREGMKVFTHSEKVVAARKGVLEFLLADHPLDCPVCDKAGECKLQDYYEEYGLFDSHFTEEKAKRSKKVEIGKTLILDRERCVLCTRCVRFLRDITQTHELGVFERGAHSEVHNYDGIPVDNNYSGNLTELCPVGAITDKDFRFQTRSWFLKSGASVCPHCSKGCNIEIESHKGFSRFPVARRVYRIKAKRNDKVNGHWICDIGRYGYDYLDENRLEDVLSFNGKKKTEYSDAVSSLIEKISRIKHMNRISRICLILNSWMTNEELFLVKKIFKDDLGVDKIFMVDPEEGEGDDFLLKSDRSPNHRGAEEMGYELGKLALEKIAESTELLVVFGRYLLEHFSYSDLQSAFHSIPTRVNLSAHAGEGNDLFDFVLPVPLIAEKSGSLTNTDGLIQHFSPALESLGQSRPEIQVLAEIGKSVGSDFSYYRQFQSSADVFNALKEEIPFFRK